LFPIEEQLLDGGLLVVGEVVLAVQQQAHDELVVAGLRCEVGQELVEGSRGWFTAVLRVVVEALEEPVHPHGAAAGDHELAVARRIRWYLQLHVDGADLAAELAQRDDDPDGRPRDELDAMTGIEQLAVGALDLELMSDDLQRLVRRPGPRPVVHRGHAHLLCRVGPEEVRVHRHLDQGFRGEVVLGRVTVRSDQLPRAAVLPQALDAPLDLGAAAHIEVVEHEQVVVDPPVDQDRPEQLVRVDHVRSTRRGARVVQADDLRGHGGGHRQRAQPAGDARETVLVDGADQRSGVGELVGPPHGVVHDPDRACSVQTEPGGSVVEQWVAEAEHRLTTEVGGGADTDRGVVADGQADGEVAAGDDGRALGAVLLPARPAGPTHDARSRVALFEGADEPVQLGAGWSADAHGDLEGPHGAGFRACDTILDRERPHLRGQLDLGWHHGRRQGRSSRYPQHGFGGGDPPEAGWPPREAIGHGAQQPAVDVDRGTRHPAPDAADAVDLGRGDLDDEEGDAWGHGVLQDADHLDVEALRRGTPRHRQAVAGLAGNDLGRGEYLGALREGLGLGRREDRGGQDQSAGEDEGEGAGPAIRDGDRYAGMTSPWGSGSAHRGTSGAGRTVLPRTGDGGCLGGRRPTLAATGTPGPSPMVGPRGPSSMIALQAVRAPGGRPPAARGIGVAGDGARQPACSTTTSAVMLGWIRHQYA
jgi:hypothetical protein